jgi:hypothetical protein
MPETTGLVTTHLLLSISTAKTVAASITVTVVLAYHLLKKKATVEERTRETR